MNNLCLRWGVTSIYHEQINKEHLEIADAKQLILDLIWLRKVI